MRITQLSPVSFGRFQNRELAFAPGINLIEAPNEAGKSTLAAFVSGMLYGFYRRQDPKRRQREAAFDRYRPWANPGRYFGSMTLVHEGVAYRLERDFLKDEVRLFEADTGRDVTDRLPYHDALRIYEPGAYFLGISQTAFEGTLYVPQRSVEAGGALGKELADQIDSLSEAGTGGVSASGAVRWLEAQRDAIGTPRRGSSPLGEQYAKLSALQAEKAESEARRSAAAREGARAQSLEGEIASLEAAQRADEAALSTAERDARWKRARSATAYRQRVMELESALRAMPAGSADEAALEGALEDLRRVRDLDLESDEMASALDELDGRIGRAPALPETHMSRRADAPGRARQLAARYEALPAPRPVRALTALGAGLAAAALAGFFYPPAFALAAPAALFIALGIARHRTNQRMEAERADILAALGLASPDGFAGLVAALEEARDLGTRRDTLEEQREGKLQQADALWRRVRRAMAGDGFGVPSSEVEAEAMLRERQRQNREREEALRELDAAKRLLNECLGGDDYEALIAQAAPAPEGAPSAGTIAPRIRARAERIHEMKEEMAGCAARRDAIENAGRAPAEIEGEMQLVREKIEALTREVNAIEEAKRRIEEAADAMRKSLSPVLSLAIRRLSGAVTLGRYGDLAVDTGLNVHVLADGRTISPDELSGGTADAIHLALRLGLIEFLMGDRECPVILDDSFSQLDDDRAARMLEAVAAFASGRQALILTCQPRVRRMLETLGIPHSAVGL